LHILIAGKVPRLIHSWRHDDKISDVYA
jgi:hypothetical protein